MGAITSARCRSSPPRCCGPSPSAPEWRFSAAMTMRCIIARVTWRSIPANIPARASCLPPPAKNCASSGPDRTIPMPGTPNTRLKTGNRGRLFSPSKIDPKSIATAGPLRHGWEKSPGGRFLPVRAVSCGYAARNDRLSFSASARYRSSDAGSVAESTELAQRMKRSSNASHMT
ncbi:hypothetical protein SDC9_88754 [bioreactor metagenome]|uniref:Uncharacterized protein n=1 Tax=bioreactor metagenome TaxID=1076179 RepID=A0A644ZMN9_9ZZZZ